MSHTRLRHPRKRLAAAAAALALIGTMLALPTPAFAATGGEITTSSVSGTAAGTVDYAIYTPPGYADSDERYPTLYLLHGRGDTMAAWQQVKGDLDEMILAGDVPPMIVVMPDAPWSQRGNWYTDSLYTGSAGAGSAVETALAVDLVEHIDTTYRTVDDRAARAAGGYSMGGAGALRFVLAHQETFSGGLILSPAAYQGAPPNDSSAREYGAYGVGDALYDQARYDELSYETALANFDASLGVHLYLAVGDDEWANPDPVDAKHDLDMATHLIYTSARRVSGITAELRVIDGGHDWDVWQPAFRDGVKDLAGYLRTSPLPEWDAELMGSAGDDRASGIVELENGDTVHAVTVADAYADVPYSGAMDIVVERRDSSGAVLWRTPIATSSNDRAYGVVDDGAGGVIVAGYTRSDDAGQPGASDQVLAAGLDANGGIRWRTRFGDTGAADRIYAMASDGAGGAYLTGYTGGAAVTPSAGDKDIIVMRVDNAGEIVFADQFGSAGEDKGQGIALAADGGAYLAGIAGDALPGQTSNGGTDAFVAKYAADGSRTWIQQFGTSETDQAWAAVARESGFYVVGHTKGALGGESAGDHDMYVRAMTDAGSTEWTTQFGTATDDRAIAGVLGADGGLMVVGTSYGAMADQVSGVDIVTAEVSASGTVGEITQFGSVARDGTDEWDDANLFASPGSVWITGLTYGAPTGKTNAGSGDVFISHVPYDSAGGADPEPTVSPSAPSTPAPSTPPATPSPTDPPTTSATPAPPGSGTTDPTEGAVIGAPSDRGGLANTGVMPVFFIALAALGALAFGLIARARRRNIWAH